MQTTHVCRPLRFKREEVVEGCHSIDPAGRKLELVSDEKKEIVFKVTKQFLRFVQHLDE